MKIEIPRKSTFKLISRNLDPVWMPKVMEFITPYYQWDVPKLRQVVCEADVEAILESSISLTNMAYMWALHYSKNGLYTVTSNYKLATNQRLLAQSISNNNSMDSWKNLWKIQVPSKIKLFLWKRC